MADKSLPSIQSRVKIVQIEKRKEEMNMKKFFAILMTLALMLSLAVPAMAAKVENHTEHEYDAYQIFVATGQNGDGGPLGNITWGNGINKASFLTALQGDARFVKNGVNIFASCSTAQDVAEALAANTDVAPAFADVAVENKGAEKADVPANGGTANLGLGYWLLVDTTEEKENETNFAKNAALLQVINNGNLTIEAKYDVPEVGKTVDDNDVNIGDTVTFTLTATMPTRLDGYETYKVVFHDTLSKGLTFGSITSVTVGDSTTDVKAHFTLNPSSPSADTTTGKTTFTLTCNDVLAQNVGATAGSTIVVKYTAIVDTDAVIGTEGNLNEVYLEYSNDPNWNGTPGSDDEPTGDTPKDDVKVNTWEIPVFKYTKGDGDAKIPLDGAGFTLYKNDAAVNLVAAGNNEAGDLIYKVCTKDDGADHTHVTQIVTGETGKFEIEGLEQGTYVLKETKTPDGYNTCDDITVEIGEDGVLTVKGTTVTTVEILNQAGATLPETGGMGTTIFYIVGGIMVVAAVVLLVTKKRMSAEG